MRDHPLNICVFVILAFAGLGLFPDKAHAGEVAACTVGGGTLAFGNYQPSNGNRTTAGSVQMSCTCRGNNDTPVTGSTFVALSGAGSNAVRTLQNVGSALTYGVYSDANFSNLYPSVAGSAVFSFVGTCPPGQGNSIKPLSFATPPAFTLYGRILDVGTNLNSNAGLYTGTLTLTINY
jgi:spore coat protein U-like protein